MQPEGIHLRMERPDLDGLPAPTWPEGWCIRCWQAGDDRTWTALQRASEPYVVILDDVFARAYGHDPATLAERVYFLSDRGGDAHGTIAAWYDEADAGLGRIHWLAVHPEARGRGLGRELLRFACGRLRELGHSRAFLHTSSNRLVALRLYLNHGFQPVARNEAEELAWGKIRRELG